MPERPALHRPRPSAIRPPLVLVLLLGGLALALAACASQAPAGRAAPPPYAGPGAGTPGPVYQAHAGTDMSSLFAQEPVIGVLLAQGAEVGFSTLEPGEVGGASLPAGAHRASVAAGRVAIDGIAFAGTAAVHLEPAGAGQARFEAEVQPPRGVGQLLRLPGEPLLVASGAQVLLIERVPLETYLAGVLPAEMSSRWPLAALEAQAVAARSYACARIVQRARQPWQLHWSGSLDMAYGGVAGASPVISQALQETRGYVLVSHGQPLAALFCASSGGRTESAEHLASQGVIAGDLPIIPGTMPVVEDAADQAGAAGLGKSATHWRWTAELQLDQLSSAMQATLRAQPGLGGLDCEIVGLLPESTFADSGRLAEVQLRVRAGGRIHLIVMPAARFRIAAGPGVVRSVWWERCVPLRGGRVLIQGRGFGHGVGLSQVSAWAMAESGARGEDILAVFYHESSLERLYP